MTNVDRLVEFLSRRKRLLVVDDDQGFCEFFAACSEPFVCDVTFAHNYEDAIPLIEGYGPDIMVIDVDLGGGKDGIDLFREIRRVNPRQNVWFLAGAFQPSDLDRIGAIGWAPIIRKPVDMARGKVFEDMMRSFGVQLKECPDSGIRQLFRIPASRRW